MSAPTGDPLPLRDYQEDIVLQSYENLMEEPSLLVTAPTGSGKCHPAGTKVIMYDGTFRAVEEIMPGDRLMGPDSRPRLVASTSTGYGHIVEIKPVRGDPWKCNDEHVLTLVRTGEPGDLDQGRRNRNGETLEITVNEYREKSKYWKHVHKLFRSGEISFDEPADGRELLIPPYIMGMLLGDGDLTNGRVQVTTEDPEILQSLEEYAEQVQLWINKSPGEDRTPTYRFTSGNRAGINPVLNHCRTMGVSEHRAGDKFIPPRYLTARPKDRLELLAGLIDTDGSLDRGIYDYLSKSKRMAQETCFAARSVGLAATLKPKEQREGTYWRVTISGDTDRIPCRVARKKAGRRRQKKTPLRTGFSVLDAGLGRYYGFTLDGDGRYLLSDFTVTHNTVAIAEIAARVIRKRRRGALLVHREELVAQAEQKIAAQTGAWPGVVWQSRREWDQPFTIIAQDTLSGADIPPDFRIHILMIDEAHHTVAPGWLRSIRRLDPVFLLGFSATPFRQDREPLSPEPFARVIRPITPHELIERDILCHAVIESPIIHDHNGQVQPINRAANLPGIYLQAVRHAIARGRNKILLYASQTREHTPLEIIRQTARALQENGITADAVHQHLSRPGRRAALSRFKNTAGASTLVNYQTLTEGTDLPYVDCVIIGRHTESESTIIQMIGRGLRKHELKSDCLVLNYSGRPDMDDIIHYWRLDTPREEGASSPRNQGERMSKTEMEELAARFPMEISLMDEERERYPWFRPFAFRPLLALPLRSGRGEERYVTVEPARERNGGWKVSRVTLHSQGSAPLSRQQSAAPSTQEAVRMVRMELGENAPILERSAGWRLQQASGAQLEQWKKLYPEENHGSLTLTAGEASDGIAMKRFQNRVDPRIL